MQSKVIIAKSLYDYPSGSHIEAIDLHDINAGIYLLNIKTASGHSFTKKLVVPK